MLAPCRLSEGRRPRNPRRPSFRSSGRGEVPFPELVRSVERMSADSFSHVVRVDRVPAQRKARANRGERERAPGARAKRSVSSRLPRSRSELDVRPLGARRVQRPRNAQRRGRADRRGDARAGSSGRQRGDRRDARAGRGQPPAPDGSPRLPARKPRKIATSTATGRSTSASLRRSIWRSGSIPIRARRASSSPATSRTILAAGASPFAALEQLEARPEVEARAFPACHAGRKGYVPASRAKSDA